MIIRSLLTPVLLSCLFALAAPAPPGEPHNIAPAVTWEGVALRNIEAAGPPEIKVLANAKAFQDRWQAWRPKEDAPKVNFTDYFAVQAVQPGGQYYLRGLALDGHGKATVRGFGALQQINVPKGYGYTIAIFPRKGVKTVNGHKLSSGK